MTRSILVTGAAGFIGSNFVYHYLDSHPDRTIIGYDNLTYAGNLDNLRDIEKDPRYKFVKGDIADAKLVNELVAENKFDLTVNFAAETHVDRSILWADDFIKTDVLGAFTLLEAAREFGVKKFIQISTDSVSRGRLFPSSPMNTVT